MASFSRWLTLAAALLLGVAVAHVPGCSKAAAPARRTPDATYTVRGKVTAVPVPGKKDSEFRVHHEAIDDFKDKDGRIVGMGAMVMDFPPAKGVRVDQFKVGDIVEVTFSVWWGDLPPWEAVRVAPLPADTKLEFRRANPPKPAAPSAPPAPAAPATPPA